MAQPAVRVAGLRELDRALKRSDSLLRSELKEAMREVGGIVADEAQNVARSKGLVDSGRLVKSIRPRATPTAAFVRVLAKKKSRKYPGGYPYPAVYEYGAGRARAFLKPALDRKEREVVEKVDEMVLGRIEQKFSD